MQKRRMIHLFATVILFGGGLLLTGCGSREAQPPNILFLFADDQRFDTIHALGNAEVKTPNMDRLVQQGVAFTHAFIQGSTSGAVCAPSRAMLLTGRALHQIPASFAVPWTVPEPERGDNPYLTFPEVYRQHGYVTFGTGKWHNERQTYARGFTHGGKIFFGGMADHLKTPVYDFDPSGEYPQASEYTGEKFSTEMFAEAAIGFLNNHDTTKPFLAYVPFTAPHDPRMAPDEYEAMYPPEKISLPENFMPEHPFDNGELRIRDEKLAPWPRTPEIVKKEIGAYYAMITHLDTQIGHILDTLEATGMAANTIIIFAGDNGLAVGQHGLMGKQNLYEHSVRVPLIFAGPGIPKDQKSDALCYLLDVFPTLCDFTGVMAPDTIQGKSVAGVLRGEVDGPRDSVYFCYRHFQRGVRTERWKLILYNVKGTITTQLFDLESDPREMKNLAGESEQSGRVEELRELLKKHMRENGDPLDLDQPGWGYVELEKE